MSRITDFFLNKKIKIALISVLTVFFALACFVWYIYPMDAIAKGVCVGNTDLSGLSILEAEKALKIPETLHEKKIILLDSLGKEKEFSGLDIMLSQDVKKTVEKAFEVGRSEDVFSNLLTLSKLIFKPYDIGYKYSYDEGKLEKIIYDFGASINGEEKDYTLEFKNGEVYVSKGVPGQNKDVLSVLNDVKSEIENENYRIKVKMEKVEPPMPSAKGLLEYVYTEPENATYEINDGVISITDEKYGISVDEEEVNAKIEKLISGEVIALKVNEIKPEVTKSDLYNQLFNHTLGSFSSKYSTSNKNRSQNVNLASKLIDGLILAPGEVFSYNDTVGPRTTARGFREAAVYSNGQSVMGVGGGICQVSSTLYSAVLYSDLEICERRNHSMTIDYMPKGQDATVSYGTIDFKFRNNTNNPIRISSVASGGTLTVSIYGTKPETEKTVKIVNNTVSVIEKTLEKIEDANLFAGETKTVSVGKTGYVIDTYRKVYENGVEVKNEYLGRSKYKMVPQKLAVGVAGKESPAPVETVNSTEMPVEPSVDADGDIDDGEDVSVFAGEATEEPYVLQEEETETLKPEEETKEDITPEPIG